MAHCESNGHGPAFASFLSGVRGYRHMQGVEVAFRRPPLGLSAAVNCPVVDKISNELD